MRAHACFVVSVRLRRQFPGLADYYVLPNGNFDRFPGIFQIVLGGEGLANEVEQRRDLASSSPLDSKTVACAVNI